MNNIKRCYNCNSNKFFFREGKVRDNNELKIIECETCGLVFLSSHEHINDEFYNDSQMHGNELPNMKKWRSETYIDDIRRFNYIKKISKNKSILDFGCGNGGFLKLFKKTNKCIAGLEPELISRKSLIDEGFNIYDYQENIHQKYDIITLFHVIEHLKDPVSHLLSLKNNLAENGKIIIETPNANDVLLSIYKNKAFSEFTYWSCHLYLFNEQTLKDIVNKAGLKIDNILQIQRYPLTNHLYWLANSAPGGHEKFNILNDNKLNKLYEKKLSQLKVCDSIFAEISIQ